MIKAFVRNGVIVPHVPLPNDWQEGTEVEVVKGAAVSPSDEQLQKTDAWMNQVEAIAAQGDPADDSRLEAAIQQVRVREKEIAVD